MAAGCAVITTDIAANSALIEHGRTGILIPVGDPDALHHAFTQLVENQPLRQRLGTAARAEVLGSTWETTSTATGKILKGACETHER
jgi:phosphatidylinositol alpha 1,6-mannosyltransferase